MYATLANPWFHIVGVPVIFVLIGALVSMLGRKDGDTTPIRNSWAVGTTMILMTIGTVMADLHSNSQNSDVVSGLVTWLVGLMGLVFISITHDRYSSWERNANGKAGEKKHIFWGIIIPTLFAATLYGIYRYSFGGQS